MSVHPDISVIIPTRNRALLLSRTLDSIATQVLATKHYEVIVVDNGSKDETEIVCQRMQDRLPNLRYIHESRPGLHEGRHAGLRAAKSELLVFADDDIRACPTWLEGMIDAFTDPKVGLVGGNNLPDFETEPPTWWEQLKIRTEQGWAIPPLSLLNFGDKNCDISPSYVWGCNFGVRRHLVLLAGGFHPDGMPKEQLHYRGDGESYLAQWIHNSGYRTRFSSRASVYHHTPATRLTQSYLFERGYAQGISKVYTVVRRHGGYRLLVRVILQVVILKQSLRLPRLSKTDPRAALLNGYRAGIIAQTEKLLLQADLVPWITQTSYFLK